jgi:ribose transport system permease protein
MSDATQEEVTTTKGKKRPTFSAVMSRVFSSRESGVFAALVVLCVIMSFASPYFLKPVNLFNVARGMSTIGIMAIGMTMVIVSGGIDLSVGSLMAVSAMSAARLMTYHELNPWVALIAGLGVGTLLGAINGLIITRVKVNPFITTLGMLSIGRGLTYLLATGLQGSVASNIPMRHEGVNFLGAGYIGQVPFPVIEMVIFVIIFSFFLNQVVLGRQIFAVGSNEQASRLSGVNVSNVRLFVYTITGFLAAWAGVMNAGLLSTAATNIGVGVELDVIAAVVIGGASLMGGEGSILGAVFGAAIMAVIRNAFVLLKLPIYLQTITIGVVIILAVALDQFRKRRT